MATPTFTINNNKVSPVRELKPSELISIDVSLDASYCAVMYLNEGDTNVYTDVYKYDTNTNSYTVDISGFDLTNLNNVSYNIENKQFFKAKIVSTSPLLITYYVIDGSITEQSLEYTILQYDHTNGSIQINETNATDFNDDFMSFIDFRNNTYLLAAQTRDEIVILNSNFDKVQEITTSNQIELESINFSSDANSITFFTEDSGTTTSLHRYEYVTNTYQDVTTDIPTTDMSGAIQTLRASNDGKKIVLSTQGNGAFGTHDDTPDHFYEISYSTESTTWLVKELSTMSQSSNVNTYIQDNNSKNSNLFGLSKLGNRIVYLSKFDEQSTKYNCHLKYIQYNTAWTVNFDILNDFEINNTVFDNTVQLDPFVVRTYTGKTIILMFTPTINNTIQATMRVLNDEEPPFQSVYTDQIFISATIDSDAGVQTRIENQSSDSVYVYEVNKASVPPPPYYALFQMNPATISNNIEFAPNQASTHQTLGELYDNINTANPTEKYFTLDMSFNESDHTQNEYVKFTQIKWTDVSRNALSTLSDYVLDTRNLLQAQSVSIRTEVGPITNEYIDSGNYDTRVKLPFTMKSESTELTRQYTTTPSQDPNKFTIVTNNPTAPSVAFGDTLSYETKEVQEEADVLDCSGRLNTLTIPDEQLNNIMFALIKNWKEAHPNVQAADFNINNLRTHFNAVIKGIVSASPNIPLQFYVGMRLYNEDSVAANLALVGCTDEANIDNAYDAVSGQFNPTDIDLGGTTSFTGTTQGDDNPLTSVVVNKNIWTWILFDESIIERP
jgi:hypothetical protein